jgi:chorismate mutase
MSRNYGNATLKNHIAKAAPGTLAAMGQMFGISQTDFLAAVYGEPGAIQKIADMGRLSQVARDNLEKALDATKLTIETTGDINKALADLVKQTQRSGTQTMAAIYDATLAEKKMGNELTEMRDRQGYSVSAETTRHLRSSQLIQLQGTTAELMAVAKYQTDLIKEQNKPLDAQDTADRAYDKSR